jgi:hypothetical protein
MSKILNMILSIIMIAGCVNVGYIYFEQGYEALGVSDKILLFMVTYGLVLSFSTAAMASNK